MDRDETLKFLGLDASPTDDDLQQACRRLVAELGERVMRAETDAQRVRYQAVIREIEQAVAALRASIADDPAAQSAESDGDRGVAASTGRSPVGKVAIALSAIVLVVALLGIALGLLFPEWRGALRSTIHAAVDDDDRRAAAELARQRALASALSWEQAAGVLPAGRMPDDIAGAHEALSAGERHFEARAYRRAEESFQKASELFTAAVTIATRWLRDEPSIVAAVAKDLHDKLQKLERELYGRVANAQTRLDNCEQTLRRARTDDERKTMEERRREAAAELNLMKRLASISQANVFNPSLRAELRNRFTQADAHFEANRYQEALSSYTEIKSRLEESLLWPDRVESALRRQSALSREIEQLRLALGPAALNLDGVQSALSTAALQMRSGDEELAAGRLSDAITFHDSVGSLLSEVKAQAVEGLYEKAQAYDRDGQPSAAIFTLDELLAFKPGDEPAQELRRRVLSYRVTNSIGMELVFIPPGEFLMGSPAGESDRDEDERRRSVKLASGFYMAATEVTQSQWVAVMGRNPSQSKGDNLPVEQVSWDEAVEFCSALSRKEERVYRLPTEAEWEYACRAGTVTPFSFGDTISTDQANFDGESVYGSGGKGVFRNQTVSVASFPPNAWELYDMHGNVWEWCLDEITGVSPTAMQLRSTPAATAEQRAGRDATTVTQQTPSEPAPPAHVLRSGSWRSRPGHCRCANRVVDTEDSRLSNVGFRVVLESR